MDISKLNAYRLDENKNPVPIEGDGAEAMRALADAWAIENRRVADTYGAADLRVSTVFLVTDHQLGAGPPLLFETMAFNGGHAVKQWRYSTWAEAVEGHERAVREVFGGMPS